jgi:hypothetical protein
MDPKENDGLFPKFLFTINGWAFVLVIVCFLSMLMYFQVISVLTPTNVDAQLSSELRLNDTTAATNTSVSLPLISRDIRALTSNLSLMPEVIRDEVSEGIGVRMQSEAERILDTVSQGIGS